jgi:hypothetical protein
VKRALLLLEAAALLVAGCGGTTGSPNAAPTASGSASARATSTGNDQSAQLDPCSLIADSTLTKNGLIRTKGPYVANGARTCQYNRSESLPNQYTLDVGIYDHAGYQDINTSGLSITHQDVNGRSGIVARDAATQGCLVNFTLTATSHVEVAVVAASGDMGQACDLATEAAKVVAGGLPAGS